jgi:hypothetical protein
MPGFLKLLAERQYSGSRALPALRQAVRRKSEAEASKPVRSQTELGNSVALLAFREKCRFFLSNSAGSLADLVPMVEGNACRV